MLGNLHIVERGYTTVRGSCDVTGRAWLVLHSTLYSRSHVVSRLLYVTISTVYNCCYWCRCCSYIVTFSLFEMLVLRYIVSVRGTVVYFDNTAIVLEKEVRGGTWDPLEIHQVSDTFQLKLEFVKILVLKIKTFKIPMAQ